MKAFQFPLQKVLDLREMIEESRAIMLKKSQLNLKKEKEKLNNLEERKNSLFNQDENNHTGNTNLSINSLRISMDYISQLNDMITDQVKHVVKSDQVVESDRSDLLDASKDKKVVEKLRERHLENFIKDYRKKETKTESEIAIRVSVKNNINGEE